VVRGHVGREPSGAMGRECRTGELVPVIGRYSSAIYVRLWTNFRSQNLNGAMSLLSWKAPEPTSSKNDRLALGRLTGHLGGHLGGDPCLISVVAGRRSARSLGRQQEDTVP